MALTAVAVGAALALFGSVLKSALASFFWPRTALCVLMLGTVAGGLAALGVAAAPSSLVQRLRRRSAPLLALAGAAALAALPGLQRVAAGLPAGPALLSFPAALLALCSLPFVVAGAVLTAWAQAGERRRIGWVLAGAGAAWLAVAALAGRNPPHGAPWLGGHLLEYAPGGDGSVRLVIDRGLRADTIAPRSDPPPVFYPPAGPDGRAEALLIGFPNGPLLESLLERPGVQLTVLEEDRVLVEQVLGRWPALAIARAAGRVRFVFGNPRWTLERSAARYGLIALAPGWTPGARVSRALNQRADHRFTVEAFRSYLAHLRPDGYLLVRRDGIGRVVTTLREAAGLPVEDFTQRLVVIGDRGQPVSQSWYLPAGPFGQDAHDAVTSYEQDYETKIFFRPSRRELHPVYDMLVKGRRVRGLYFSTPLDLSPALDERPYFDHFDRVAISPSGPSLPEEPDPPPPDAGLRLISPGDRDLWGVLLAGLGLSAALLAAGARRPGGAAAGAAGRGPAVSLGLFCGAGAALALDAFGAWAHWLAPSAPAAQAAIGAVLFGAGSGWLTASRRTGVHGGFPALSALTALFAAAAYRSAPFVPRLGFAVSALVVAAAGALLGLALGRALGAAAERLSVAHPAAGGWFAGAALCAASLAWATGRLAAPHFGDRLLWGLSAAAALAAWRELRRLPAAGPGCPAT